MPTPPKPSTCNSPAVEGEFFACGHRNAGMRGPNGECQMPVFSEPADDFPKPSTEDWDWFHEVTYSDPFDFISSL